MGALFSSIIECIQLFLPNRTTDINDVILNTIGTVAGYLLFRFVEKDEEKQQVNKRSDHSV
jgi:glycopeptide antibiotics resistance protein